MTTANYPDLVKGMEDRLVQYGPLSHAIQAGHTMFYQYLSGIITSAHSCPDDSVDHAMVIVGLGTEWRWTWQLVGGGYTWVPELVPYWITMNSWGTGWGESGFMRIERVDNTVGICAAHQHVFWVETIDL